jgi:hypothetical protein
MIVPCPGLELRTERPGLRIRWPVRVCGRYFRRWLRPWRERIRLRNDARLSQLMRKVSECKSRADLESLLGPPKYGVQGAGYGSKTPGCAIQRPDSVEYYEQEGLDIRLWFKDGKLWQIGGSPKLIDWDVVCSDDYWD